MLEGIREKMASNKKRVKKNIAVFVDGPNILRKEFGVNLADVKESLLPFGSIKIGKVFLNQFASEKLVEAIVNQGFESVISVGDIDVAMAVEAMEAVFNPSIGLIAFVSRDADFWPVMVKAKRYGKDTAVLLVDESAGASLKNTSDFVIVLKRKA